MVHIRCYLYFIITKYINYTRYASVFRNIHVIFSRDNRTDHAPVYSSNGSKELLRYFLCQGRLIPVSLSLIRHGQRVTRQQMIRTAY